MSVVRYRVASCCTHLPAPASSPRPIWPVGCAVHRPAKSLGAEPVRFQWSVPEPTRIALVNSLVERFNQSQKDFAVQVEYVPQAQARQKLMSSIAEIRRTSARSGTTGSASSTAWARSKTSPHAQNPEGFANSRHGVADRDDQRQDHLASARRDARRHLLPHRPAERARPQEPTPDWTWDEFLGLAKAFTKADKNQYGYGMRGSGTWALLYPSEFAYANGAEVSRTARWSSTRRKPSTRLPGMSTLRSSTRSRRRVRRRTARRNRRNLRARRHQHVPA